MKKFYLILNCLFLFAGTLLSQTPYASYPLDNNANDVSGNSLNGTINGAPTPTTNRFNQPNKALLFNGSTDYIVLPSAFDFPNRSVIVWFNATQFGSSNGGNFVYVSDNPNLQNGLSAILTYINDQNSNTRLNNNIADVATDQFQQYASMDSNRWYQAAFVRTPTVTKAYLNGALISSRNTPDGTQSTNTNVSYTAVVGADRGFNALFNGKIDDLEVYNVAISDTLIQANYNAGGYNVLNDTNYVTVSTTDTLIINATLTGVSAPNNINTLKVFPNPAKDHIYINTGNYASMSGYSIKIVNSLGQQVFQSAVNQQQFYIDLNSWTGAGTYVLSIINAQSQIIEMKEIEVL